MNQLTIDDIRGLQSGMYGHWHEGAELIGRWDNHSYVFLVDGHYFVITGNYIKKIVRDDPLTS